MRDNYVCAVSFADFPNVIYLMRFLMDATGVPLKLNFTHPRTKETVWVYYRGTSKAGKNIYFYKEAGRGGEIRGG
jgi:hypothetical protein